MDLFGSFVVLGHSEEKSGLLICGNLLEIIPKEYSASEPSPPEHEKLLSVSDPRYVDAALDGKMKKYPHLSRDTITQERDRITHEHMLVRYGSWSSVRVQVLAYTILLFVGFIYKSHVDFYEFTASLHTVHQGRHIQCCCEKPTRAEYLRELEKQFHSRDFYHYLKYLIPFVAGLTCPMWERYISRHSVLLGSVLAGVPCSILFMFSHTEGMLMFIHSLQNFCMTGTMLISMITLTEILPYHLRFLAVAAYLFVGGLANAITTLHFHFGFSLLRLGLLTLSGYSVGILVVLFVAQDSILHMNIRNDADIVEKVIRKKESRLFQSKPEGDIYYHTRVAKKIFEDLVYLDRDELKLSNFFMRLWRNSIMFEIALALFQSLSAGMLDYELTRFWNERFAGPYMIGVDRILGYPFVALMTFMLRKFHRVKAISLVSAITLLLATSHHFLMKYDKTNRCAEFKLAEPRFEMLLTIINVVYNGFVTCYMIMILMHFLETAPSSLRMSCLVLVYLPFQIVSMFMSSIFTGQSCQISRIVLVYAYHLIITVVTAIRARSSLSFSLYLFDLMPQSEREPESERVKSDEDDQTQNSGDDATSPNDSERNVQSN